MCKAQSRLELEQAQAEFLANGGQIKKVASKSRKRYTKSEWYDLVRGNNAVPEAAHA